MNDELEKINQRFNEQIDKNDNDFSLTKIFKKKGMLNNITKGVLLFSLSVGAFGNMVNASPIIESLNKQATIEKVLENRFKSKNTKIIEADSQDILDTESLKDISENHLSGIWRLPVSGKQVIITQSGQFKSENKDDTDFVQDFLIDNEVNPKNTAPYAAHFYDHDIELVNLDSGYFKVLYDSIGYSSNFEDEFPLINKYQNDLILTHELNHIEKGQLENKADFKESGSGVFAEEVLGEINSDIASFFITSKMNNLDLKEGLSLLKELSRFRTDSLHSKLDVGHSTQIGLDPLIKVLENNPDTFEMIKNLSPKKLDNFASDFAQNAFEQLNDRSDLKTSMIRAKDIRKDLESHLKNGSNLSMENTNLSRILTESGIQNVDHTIEKLGYKSKIEDMADQHINDGLSTRKASGQYSYLINKVRQIQIISSNKVEMGSFVDIVNAQNDNKGDYKIASLDNDTRDEINESIKSEVNMSTPVFAKIKNDSNIKLKM